MPIFRDHFTRTLAAYVAVGLVVATSIHLLVASSPKYGALLGRPPAAEPAAHRASHGK